MNRLKLGMLGGRQGAFIGGVHRIASRIDDRFELVAGALASDLERAAVSADELGIAADRSYANFDEMATAEAAQDDGIDAVSIVAPNHVHSGPIIAFLEAGINVICDKPLCASAEEANAIEAAVSVSKARFILTHNYNGYPLIRHAREMIARGDLGAIRAVQAEYVQDWLTETIEDSGQKQASWRTDPVRSGEGGAIGDIGTHAFNLLTFVTGLGAESLSADLHSFGTGRQVDDNAHIMLRLENGARGMLWASQVAVGRENGLRLRIYGEKGGLEWDQENPNRLTFTAFGEPTQTFTRGGAGVGDRAGDWTRIPPGHPEGYLEGFANLYSDAADVISGVSDGVLLPGIKAGLDGMWFIQACISSSQSNGTWIKRNSKS
ncbi:putative dehydrogenase [Litoreibacter halocynthiae]|uniref:Putative dehydrogenase n=1 Tax=Litoreibacter halocynthiae TaxID=1242689 RepID=A0A4R7LIK4_9RHOB|nr:Gfo/Idh/MocA family oxidoreductase [Litoreibacter halocynthiae]TDT75653.1 putative dehydrogenase [Litoreibacter halocynthiae]